MGIQTIASDGGDIGDSRDLEIQSAPVETSEFDGGEFVIAEDVHEVGVVLSIGRRSCARHELNFALDSGKEAANAHEPAVLNVVEVSLCVLYHGRVCASL